jgi:peptidoglycan/xylan/chitin deacetylase (PgdA/CDA1 family)
MVGMSMSSTKKSAFVLSLDFELLWGVYDSRGAEYYPSIERVFTVVPKLLDLFNKYEVACTWATVGAILLENVAAFENYKPSKLPGYTNTVLSPYNSVNTLAVLNPRLLFGAYLVRCISNTPKQEVGSHTFSHYYALEAGQTIDEFQADLDANLVVASTHGLKLNSFVFPRNQFNSKYLEACDRAGFTAYRGNPNHWAYAATAKNTFDMHKRAFRLIDAYIPVSGALVHKFKLDRSSGIYDIPASLFFRPFSKRLKIFEFLKLSRIKYSMRRAAKDGGVFHLWWHPHNFSSDTEKNISQIEELLKYFKYLNGRYGMRSMSMNELVVEQEKL